MVNDQASRLDAAFMALAHPIRRAMVERLARGSATAGELAEPFDVSLPAMSRHLRVLERAGFVTRARDGRLHRIDLAQGSIGEAMAWLDRTRQFWEARLDSLGAFLERTREKESTAWPPKLRRTSRSASSGSTRSRRSGSSTHGRRRNR